MHRGLGDRYLLDDRFAPKYEKLQRGLPRFVHLAIVANADRLGHPTA